MDELYNFNTHYIKVRKLENKLILEVWELYTNFLRLQVPLSHYQYKIYGEKFRVIKK